jgi:hypothetical protein
VIKGGIKQLLDFAESLRGTTAMAHSSVRRVIQMADDFEIVRLKVLQRHNISAHETLTHQFSSVRSLFDTIAQDRWSPLNPTTSRTKTASDFQSLLVKYITGVEKAQHWDLASNDFATLFGQMVKLIDTDGDGKLSMEEFIIAFLSPQVDDVVDRNYHVLMEELKQQATLSDRLRARHSQGNKQGENADDTVCYFEDGVVNKTNLPVVAVADQSQLTVPHYHWLSSLSMFTRLVAIQGDALILHPSLVRTSATNVSTTTVVPCGVMLPKPRGNVTASIPAFCYFYEVSVVKSKGSVSVGWMDGCWASPTSLSATSSEEDPQKHVWTVMGKPAVVDGGGGGGSGGSGNAGPASLFLSAGDTVGCLVDLVNGYARYFRNGEALEFSQALVQWKYYLSPVVIFEAGFEFHMNLGQRGFRYPPPSLAKPVFSSVALILSDIVSKSTEFLRIEGPVCSIPNTIAVDLSNLQEISMKAAVDVDSCSSVALLKDCAVFSGKWFVEVELKGYMYWNHGIGCVGPDFFPAFDIFGNDPLGKTPGCWACYPSRAELMSLSTTARYYKEGFSMRWEHLTLLVHMRIDMDERCIAFYERDRRSGSLQLLCRFDCIETLMVQPVFVVAPHWSGATTRLLKHVGEQDGFKNLLTRPAGNVDVKWASTSSTPLPPPAAALGAAAAVKGPLRNAKGTLEHHWKVTSGAPFVSCVNGRVSCSSGYPSLVSALGPVMWSEEVLYYEVTLVELGGFGRGNLCPERDVISEGGFLSIGWADPG